MKYQGGLTVRVTPTGNAEAFRPVYSDLPGFVSNVITYESLERFNPGPDIPDFRNKLNLVSAEPIVSGYVSGIFKAGFEDILNIQAEGDQFTFADALMAAMYFSGGRDQTFNLRIFYSQGEQRYITTRLEGHGSDDDMVADYYHSAYEKLFPTLLEKWNVPMLLSVPHFSRWAKAESAREKIMQERVLAARNALQELNPEL